MKFLGAAFRREHAHCSIRVLKLENWTEEKVEEEKEEEEKEEKVEEEKEEDRRRKRR